MDLELFTHINLVSGYVMLVLSLVLVFIHMPSGKAWSHFRLASRFIAFACFVLSITKFCSAYYGLGSFAPGDYISPLVVLVVGGYQALLYTCTSVAFINGSAATTRRAMRNLAGLTICALLTIGLFVLLPKIREQFIMVCCLLYTAYITMLTIRFNQDYRKAVKRLEEMYDDDMQSRLRWVRTLFYSALVVGVIALTVCMFPSSELNTVFGVFTLIFYTYVTIRMVNYVATSAFVVKTFPTGNEQQEDVKMDLNLESCNVQPADLIDVNSVEKALKVWVEQRRYAVPDTTVDEIVVELGVSKSSFLGYFKNVLDTQFRTWRRELRIREAMRLLKCNSNISMTELMDAVGYNDRSNFYRDFQQIAGCSIREFR